MPSERSTTLKIFRQPPLAMHLARLFQPQPPSEPLDWPALIPEASAESVLPALWQRVQSLGLTATLQPEICQLLKIAESLNAERNQRILAEATHVAALLNSIGVEPVALKGLAYLLTGVYANPSGRYLQDIDFLILESQLPSAIALLNRHEFVTDDSDPLAPLRQHSPGLQRPYCPAVELHHCLGLGVCRRLLPATEVIRDSTLIEVPGARFLVPSATHLASHLILHSQLSHPYQDRIFPPLRALCDLQLLTETLPIDWATIAERYRQHGQYLTLALHFKEAERVLRLQPPFTLELGLPGKVRWLHRRMLAEFPRLRFVDPAYLLPFFLLRRLRMLRQVAVHPQHWSRFARALVHAQYYRNLLRL